MDGAFVIDKPAGMTSHDVVDVVRRSLHTKRVGHAGTLDPDATGVLLVGVGKATRFLSYAQASPKRYEACVRFGQSTSTQDASGEVMTERPVEFDAGALDVELKSFVGEIEQIPPMVSAVRIGGERLHVKARRGEVVERPVRHVTIFELKVTEEAIEDRAEVTLDVRCSGGTYIRTLANDLGEALGCGAHLRSLRRTEAGGFSVTEAIPLDDVSLESLRPMSDVVRELPRFQADLETASSVSVGRALQTTSEHPEGTALAVMHGAELLAVYRVTGDRLVADRVVPK